VNGQHPINFVYDDDRLLTEIRDESNAVIETIARNPATGMIDSTTAGVVTDMSTYNEFGELDTYVAQADGSTVYSVEYERDHLGRITQKSESLQGGPTVVSEYRYDPAGRLWQVVRDSVLVATYTYDDNGNRLTGPGLTGIPVYDDQDRLIEYNGAVYTYTVNGELASKTASGQTTTYQYDPLGNLRTVVLPGSPPTEVEYVIDARSRRVGRQVDGSPGRNFLFGDQFKLLAEADDQNRIKHRFIYGSKPNIPDYMIQYDNSGQITAQYRVISDHLGSVRLVVDVSAATIAQRINYDGSEQPPWSPGPGTYSHSDSPADCSTCLPDSCDSALGTICQRLEGGQPKIRSGSRLTIRISTDMC
jgi:YD repeat-containing protein